MIIYVLVYFHFTITIHNCVITTLVLFTRDVTLQIFLSFLNYL